VFLRIVIAHRLCERAPIGAPSPGAIGASAEQTTGEGSSAMRPYFIPACHTVIPFLCGSGPATGNQPNLTAVKSDFVAGDKLLF